ADPADTLAHGIPIKLEGVVLDSITLKKRPLVRQPKQEYRSNIITAPQCDTFFIDTVLVQTPGRDTFHLAQPMEYDHWTVDLVFPKPIRALKPSSPEKSIYDIHYFGVLSGLPSSSIIDVFCDRSSNIWIGVAGKGVIRYDGYSFLHFSMENGLVAESMQDIYQDKSGNMWFSTRHGVSKFDGQRFENYRLKGEHGSNITNVIEDSEGNICMSTWGDGMVILSDTLMLSYGPEQGSDGNIIYCLKKGPNGAIWMGLRNQGLAIYENGSFHIYPQFELPDANSVRAIDFDSQGRAWIGTEQGMLLFDREKGEVYDYTEQPFLGTELVWETMVDSRGWLWTAGFGAGIFCYDGETVRSINVSEGLGHKTSRSFAEDNHGIIWMSTDYGGVNILKPNGFEYIKSLPAFSTIDIRDIAWYKGELWAHLYGQGILIFRGNEVEFLEGIPNKLNREFFIDVDSNLWMASTYRLFKFDGELLSQYDFLSGTTNYATVSSFCQDSQGRIWMGREAGLMVFDGDEFVDYGVDQGFISEDGILALHASDNCVWIGSSGHGLYKYEDDRFTRYGREEGLSNEMITALYETDEGLWIGTNGGGIYLMQEDESFQNFRMDDGVSDNYIQSFTEDANGRLWISTENGLTVYDGERFVAHTSQSGLNMSHFARGSVAVDDDGTIWWGSSSGLLKVNST
ncbi:hypothetical protein JYT21_00555, partial [bacterium AH-315-B15]|nr:hypothetical protein [bacterium AH-315-B15]